MIKKYLLTFANLKHLQELFGKIVVSNQARKKLKKS